MKNENKNSLSNVSVLKLWRHNDTFLIILYIRLVYIFCYHSAMPSNPSVLSLYHKDEGGIERILSLPYHLGFCHCHHRHHRHRQFRLCHSLLVLSWEGWDSCPKKRRHKWQLQLAFPCLAHTCRTTLGYPDRMLRCRHVFMARWSHGRYLWSSYMLWL